MQGALHEAKCDVNIEKLVLDAEKRGVRKAALIISLLKDTV